jgi:transcriptional regulator GlxA family with amidase domain
MKIAILTFDGFNEIDSFVASYMINRVSRPGWKAEITCPTPVVESGRGVRVHAQQPLEFASEADAVLVGSGAMTGRLVEDRATMSRVALDPRRQLIGSQCSGALVLAKLGMLETLPACTDRGTRPLLESAGVRVLEQPFFARANVATAGGCLSSHYLATWFLWRLAGRDAAEEALAYVAPVGQESQYVSRAMGVVGEFINGSGATTSEARSAQLASQSWHPGGGAHR